MPTLGVMEPLPQDFARHLAEVLEPGQEAAAADIIQAAVQLDDMRLECFMALLADRIRSSSEPISSDELRRLLSESTGGHPTGS
jgi:hypothetical protein